MIFRRKDISMGGIPGVSEFSRKVADPDMIKTYYHIFIEILDQDLTS